MASSWGWLHLKVFFLQENGPDMPWSWYVR